MRSESPEIEIREVLDALEDALKSGDVDAALDLFDDDCYWRDMVSFTWNLLTLQGKQEIRDMLMERLDDVRPTAWTVEPWPEPYGEKGSSEGFFVFETEQVHGGGYLRLRNGRIWTILTTAQQLAGFEEPGWDGRRPFGLVRGEEIGRPTWTERRAAESERIGRTDQPFVLIVGGGHSGIILGARLKKLGVPALIVESNPRPGDNWRKRYKTLQLHNPVWENHLPYLPFPDDWPVYMNKDKFADWLEAYTTLMELDFWGSTRATSADYDDETGTWTVFVEREGEQVELHPQHLVLCTGSHARPVLPEIPGRGDFTGVQEHSSEHEGPDDFLGKRVVVVGSGTSAHDIAAAMASRDIDVTMIQRSPTYVVRPESFNRHVIGGIYSQEAVDRGVTAERGDMIGASVPYRLFFEVQKQAVDQIREDDAQYYDRIEESGYLLDFGPHGAGLFARALTGVNNYYIDVGAIDLFLDGRLKIESGSGLKHLTEDKVVLQNGKEIPADAIIYATGYTSMRGQVAELISPEVAQGLGEISGIGSGTPKDRGPWEGEIRNMWKPVEQEGLWFHGALIAHARGFSRYLALQLKARHEGLPTPVYRLDRTEAPEPGVGAGSAPATDTTTDAAPTQEAAR